jgi:valyl-tRNA synthetase
MAGFEYKHELPFREVYFTGIVRDKLGRKMSKSLGNSPDLLELIDRYGADACRFGIMISSPAGNDLLWDEGSNEQGRNFNNKIWNALKLVKMWEGRQTESQQDGKSESNFAVSWFENRLNEVKAQVDELYKDFRLSEILKTIYSLIWDDFCSWYLEWVKPGFEQPIDKAVYEKTVGFFEELMQMLHPFMPFITEEIYHQLKERNEGDDITIKQQSSVGSVQPAMLEQGALLKEIITAIRDTRVKNNLKPKEEIKLYIQTENKQSYQSFQSILAKQVNAKEVAYVTENISSSITAVVQKDKFFIEAETEVDTASQKEVLLKDLDYLKGFLNSVNKKLSNEKFVQNAKPEVVALEQKKKADAEDKIRLIEESLRNLN